MTQVVSSDFGVWKDRCVMALIFEYFYISRYLFVSRYLIFVYTDKQCCISVSAYICISMKHM